jgi:hypothetical protein
MMAELDSPLHALGFEMEELSPSGLAGPEARAASPGPAGSISVPKGPPRLRASPDHPGVPSSQSSECLLLSP